MRRQTLDVRPTEEILSMIHNRSVKMVNSKSLVSFLHGDVFVVLEGFAQYFNKVSNIFILLVA